MSRPKVVFIVGSGRSGSTLLGDILGQGDDVVHVGELLWYWKRVAMQPPSLCGCGTPLAQCPFWCSVADAAHWAARADDEVADAMLRLGSWSHWPSLWLRGRSGKAVWPSCGARFERLYRAIGDVAGARVIVDSSKQPGAALLVAGLDDVEAYFIHLTRDPRAVATSWRSEKVDSRSPTDSLEAIGAARATLNWNARALGTEWLVASRAKPGRFLTMSYESFVRSPLEHYRELMAFIGETPSSDVFVDANAVELRPSHTIAGNPGRWDGSIRTIGGHETWRTELAGPAQLAIAAVSAPMMHRLGYGVRPGSEPARAR